MLAYFGITARRIKECSVSEHLPEQTDGTETEHFYLLFNHIGNLIDQAFAFLPAKTGIGDGLSVAVLSDLLWLPGSM